MASRKGNRNAASTTTATSTAPWRAWKGTKSGLTIQFLEEFCIVPAGHGAGEPLKLLPFQKAWIEEVYAPGIRSANLQLPRGQGKTTLLGGLAVAELNLNEWSPDVPVVAVTVGQAARPSGVFGIASRMAQLHPELASRSLVYTSNNAARIQVPETNGICQPISTRDDAALQGLNPSLGIADELSELSPETWAALVLASGKRPESLIAGISTPGDRSSALYANRRAVLSGVPMPGFVWTEYSADDGCDINDRDQWRKANPALGYHLSEDALATDVATQAEWLFRKYRLGQWIDSDESGWLGGAGQELWEQGNSDDALEAGAPTWAGVDVSLKHDSTAVVLVQKRGDDWFADARIWSAYGAVIDQADVRAYIRQASRDYDLRAVAYDPRFFVGSAQDLQAEGLPMLEFPQSPQRLVPAFAALREVIVNGRLKHSDDELFRNHVINARPRESEGGITLKKSAQWQKIDACVALGMALAGAQVPTSSEFRFAF